MPPKEVKKTKKQLEEEASKNNINKYILEKKKEEDKLRREQEKKRKEEEEAHLRMLEEIRLKKLEDERLAQEELLRLETEESKLQPFKREFESKISQSIISMIEDEDWNKYANCDDGYINARKEKDINAFIYEFKERLENNNFIANFKLVEKNIQEEINHYDYSQSHYHNLSRLLIEGKATLDLKKIEYSLKYLNIIRELEKVKIESITKYFIENFEFLKKMILDELYKKNKEREEDLELNVEWANRNSQIKLGMWINSSDGKYRETFTKFKNINIKIKGIPKLIVSEDNIIRFFWYENDIRELKRDEYCPYISIGGVYFIDKIIHPKKSQQVKKWEMREVIGNKYINKEPSNTKLSFFFQIDLPEHLYVKDLETLMIGKYQEDNHKWSFEGFEYPKFCKEEKYFEFYSGELSIFSILLERKLFFPYKSWYLRCTSPTVAVLDLVTPRIFFQFEIGIKPSITNKKNGEVVQIGYVKLINNVESEFAHLVNREFTYDEMILQLRKSGILLTPDEQDLIQVGLKIKNYEASDRALNDIIMACRLYAVKSHSNNQKVNEEIVLAKFKPNLEFDFNFFDDEEKDWFDVAWYFNKVTIGELKELEGEMKFESSIETSRPNFDLLIKDMNKEDIYDTISNAEPSAFLANLRNFLRILNIVNMP